MFLTSKEIRQHIETIADATSAELEYCACEFGDLIAELYTLAEDIYPTVNEDRDEDAIREAVRETQYASN